ncbi:hypothetical protein [Moorena sp. SIO3I6]|uniref:hypothetical protein n=1 Tax=Moorena sp. SIO3I6 TaxID=2607831 RepID=UPI0025D31507|nr:hypothetical protein [Moorena sp. SIO3I6]
MRYKVFFPTSDFRLPTSLFPDPLFPVPRSAVPCYLFPKNPTKFKTAIYSNK